MSSWKSWKTLAGGAAALAIIVALIAAILSHVPTAAIKRGPTRGEHDNAGTARHDLPKDPSPEPSATGGSAKGANLDEREVPGDLVIEKVEPIAPAGGGRSLTGGRLTERKMFPVRTLPSPKGPATGETLSDYVSRVLGEILTLEGDADRASERAALEMEIEAFANSNAGVVDEIVAQLRTQTNRRAQEVGLILLGRIKSQQATDFLLHLAFDGTRVPTADRLPSAAAPLGALGNVKSEQVDLSVIAVRALLQDSGRTGALPPPFSNSDTVACLATTIEDPYLFGRLLDLLSDERGSVAARLEILRAMDRNLPDPADGGVGDFPRPAAVADYSERALKETVAIAQSSADPGLRRQAWQVLGAVRRSTLVGELLMHAMTESDADVRRIAVQSTAWCASEPAMRQRLLRDISDHADPGVRQSIIRGVGQQVVIADLALREAIVTAMTSDASWAVRLDAAEVLFASADATVLGRTIEALHTSSIETLPAHVRSELTRRVSAAARRTGIPIAERQRLEGLKARLEK